MSPLVLWIAGDGKPGHENQSFGLAEALARLTPVEIHHLPVEPKAPVFLRLRDAYRRAKTLPAPDLLVGAGHATHIVLLALARRTGAPCAVLMKPSLPAALFDVCLVPVHDLRGEPPANVIPTLGALNRVAAPAGDPKPGRLLLVGGPSANHGWDGGAVLDAIGEILAANPGKSWELTDSRRTPDGFRDALRARFSEIAFFPHEETGRDWLPARLAAAGETWVTEDSVSMIHEALSGGARVGLLPVPRRKPHGRIARGLDRLLAEGFATPFARWQSTRLLAEPPRVLREADRCAALLLERWFTNPR